MDIQVAKWPQTRVKIVEATITVLAEEGFDRTTTARIARQAGVGEGTIYRHFKNKEDLINTTALYASRRIFGRARENYTPEASVHCQFIQFCTDFLTAGLEMQLHHQFLEQYLNSPIGIEYRRKTLAAIMTNPDIKPIFYPLNHILMEGRRQQILKDFPLQYLVALSMGPMAFILKHSAQGFMELNEELIAAISKSCWDAIRRQTLPSIAGQP